MCTFGNTLTFLRDIPTFKALGNVNHGILLNKQIDLCLWGHRPHVLQWSLNYYFSETTLKVIVVDKVLDTQMSESPNQGHLKASF